MENKIVIKFIKEDETVELDFHQPNLGEFVKKVLSNHLDVCSDNIEVDSDVEAFDTAEFKNILITVHEEFADELNTFYSNIEKDIRTYYDDNLSDEIIKRIKSEDEE